MGGTAKRNADLAVKKGQHIQSAEEFYEWGLTQTDSKVTYLMVTVDEVAAAQQDMDNANAVPIPGTIRLHSVMPVGLGRVYTKNTSCMETCCFSNGMFQPTCPGWTLHRTTSEPAGSTTGMDASAGTADPPLSTGQLENQDEHTVSAGTADPPLSTGQLENQDEHTVSAGTADPPLSTGQLENQDEHTASAGTADPPLSTGQLENQDEHTVSAATVTTGDFVAAYYNGKPYIGRVEEIDEDDGEHLKSFMVRFGGKVGETGGNCNNFHINADYVEPIFY